MLEPGTRTWRPPRRLWRNEREPKSVWAPSATLGFKLPLLLLPLVVLSVMVGSGGFLITRASEPEGSSRE